MNNQEWVLAAFAEGPISDANFLLRDIELPVPGEGEVLVKTTYISVDPYMRGRMNAGGSGYVAGFQLNQAFVGDAIGEVIASNVEGYAVGDTVKGHFPWKRYFAAAPSAVMMYKIDTTQTPAVKYLSVLGMVGMTAYLPLVDIGAPKAGETLFVSGAAGAVGSLVGQIAKSMGLRVVGSAGSDDKVAHLLALGFDAAFNYNTEPSAAALRARCPAGIDIYYDNVGGEVLDTCLSLMNTHGRIICCGMISQYQLRPEERYGLKNAILIVGKQLRMEGFIVTKYKARYAEGMAALAALMAEGKLTSNETVREGFDQMSAALQGLFRGDNTGKMVVHV